LPRIGGFVRRREDWNRGTGHAIELVETDDIGVVEDVKRLNDEIELSVLTYFEEKCNNQLGETRKTRLARVLKSERTCQ